MKTDLVQVKNPNMVNIIFGQSHFIKTVEDLHEALVSSVPNIQFGLAFCEASGERMIRTSGTSKDLINLAAENAQTIACGHTFIIFLGNAFPINVLAAIKAVPEVVTVFAATANPLQVVVAETEQGRGVMGVIDGETPMGIEDEAGTAKRKEFIRKIGYKL
jgi:adenosine/AMP kinase